jgi:hypothetical protein
MNDGTSCRKKMTERSKNESIEKRYILFNTP